MGNKKDKKEKKTTEAESILMFQSTIGYDDLSKDQKKAYKLITDWYTDKNRKNQVFRLGGYAGSGKDLNNDTLIPTPTGSKRIDKIKVGDYVFNRHGKPIKVLGVYPQKKRDTYKLTFNNGRVSYCSKDHIWTTITDSGKFKNRTVEEMLDDYERTVSGHFMHKYYIPTLDRPVKYDKQDVPIDPYLLGAFIGNGCLTNNALAFSSGTCDVVEEICSITGYSAIRRKFSYTYVFYDGKGDLIKGKRVQTKSIFKDIPDLIGSKSHTKYIPDIYLYNSKKVRYAILQGLMDTDGSIDGRRYYITYSTVSKRLCECVIQLVNSLGYNATYYIEKPSEEYKDRYNDCYRISIACPDCDKPKFFRACKAKVKRAEYAAKNYKTKRRHDRTAIVNIEKTKPAKGTCLYVDDPEHLFLTENFVVTHNTTLVTYLLQKLDLTQEECYVTAYTGQAVNVLRRNGIFAKTIHSTFMEAYDDFLYKNGEIIMRRGLPVTITKFRPKRFIPDEVKLIVIDEASFLPKNLEDIISSHSVPILEVGDPFQLPPVVGDQCFNTDTLDFTIEQIMRQNIDSDIVDMSMRIRNGKKIPLTKYGKEVNFIVGQETADDSFHKFYQFFKASDIILTTNNKDRYSIIRNWREYILHTKNPYPIKGERLVCRRNEWKRELAGFPLTNGTQGIAIWTVGKSEVDRVTNQFNLSFQPEFIDDEYYDGLECDAKFLTRDYSQGKDMMEFKRGAMKFEYAHAITTHLSQGSTYNRILFMDRYMGHFGEEYAARLRYTAITRARSHVTYMLPYRNVPYKETNLILR